MFNLSCACSLVAAFDDASINCASTVSNLLIKSNKFLLPEDSKENLNSSPPTIQF